MESRNPRPSPQGLVSQDDGGLWMKMDSNPVTDHTESPLVTCGEKPQDETEVLPSAPSVITRYHGVMDDEGADDVFIPPPPPEYMAPLLPAEGSTDAQVNKSTVTLTNGAADATGAKGNPGGLDWHHCEKQLMAAQNEADEVIESTAQTSKESMDAVSLSKDKDSTLPKDQDQTSMEETCSRRHHQDNTTADEESSEEHEDVAVLSEGQEKCRETEREPVPSSIEENSENETHFDKEGDKKKSEDMCGLAETDSKQITENVDDVETNASSLRTNESCGPPELCKCTQNTMDTQPQVPEIPTEVSNADEEHVDSRSLNYTLTKHHWERRESDAGETLSEEMATNEAEGEGNSKITTDIQQGEELLQRLQLVQLRQDECIPKSPDTSQQVVQETRGETKGMLGTEVGDLKAREDDLTDGDEREESRLGTVEDEGAKMNLMEKEMNERNDSKDVEERARMSLSTMLVESEHHTPARAEAGDSDDDQGDNWAPADLFPVNPNETSSTQIPDQSTCHRLSVAVTSEERHIQEEAQGKQNLQRAGGVFNLADNPDVLEIPFKTDILLESIPTKDGPDQCSDWQFSKQKMKKEISQETQRELVLVNQGKIPGEYSKGEVRQLKETKLLFEAFQQDNTEGPTRLRKPPASPTKGRVYPSVLERTRSLELLSLKSSPVSRTHSLRLHKETEKSPEILRSRSPTGGPRDKTRVAPYAKQDKRVRLYKSADSIDTDVSAVETTRKGTQESPILKQNPFFKLRPALALQPEVEKDIREAREREEELRRQRCTLYGENKLGSEDGEKSRLNPTLVPG